MLDRASSVPRTSVDPQTLAKAAVPVSESDVTQSLTRFMAVQAEPARVEGGWGGGRATDPARSVWED